MNCSSMNKLKVLSTFSEFSPLIFFRLLENLENDRFFLKQPQPPYPLMNYLFGSNSTEPDKEHRKLQCRIGGSIDSLALYNPNDESNPHFIDNEIFCGLVVVRVKDFDGITRDNIPPIPTIPYFESKKRMFSVKKLFNSRSNSLDDSSRNSQLMISYSARNSKERSVRRLARGSRSNSQT
jgi:hypothetical protein